MSFPWRITTSNGANGRALLEEVASAAGSARGAESGAAAAASGAGCAGLVGRVGRVCAWFDRWDWTKSK